MPKELENSRTRFSLQTSCKEDFRAQSIQSLGPKIFKFKGCETLEVLDGTDIIDALF